jgi:cytosine/adenosine deaminase-related metal-dependent hydrolase
LAAVAAARPAEVEGAPTFTWLGLQPHAPYSAGIELYDAAERAQPRGPLSTHLAETPEEARFVRSADGPFAELLRRLGKWDDSIRPTGLSPVQLAAPHLGPRWIAAHCNYVNDADIALLAERGISVAYCPLASEYFGHAGHRYRDLLAAGVNVCLGTDSILGQPAGSAQPLGILPALRRLFARDGTHPGVLLEMATTRGLRALQIDDTLGTLRPGAPARLIAVEIDPADPADALAQALGSQAPAQPVGEW